MKFPLLSRFFWLMALSGLLWLPLQAQDDLMSMLEDMEEETTEYTIATFKGTRIMNGQSIEAPAPGVLQLMISHRFGTIEEGAYDLFGLDQANMRLGFSYGLTEHLSVGVGRSNINKTYDGFVKWKLLRQSTGKRVMPLSVAVVSAMSVQTLRWRDPDRVNYFSSRLAYWHQLLIARKFSERLSLQLSPTFIHRNLVPTIAAQNDVWAIGAGGRFKLSGSVTFNFEYLYLLPGHTADNFENSLTLGVDIETGGHVFQLLFSNSIGMTADQFVAQTTDAWTSRGVRFGFNLSRVFTAHRPKDKGAEAPDW
jgi:hypothetical protein